MKPKVFVLGTFHMKQTADMINHNGEGFVQENQEELKELIEKLKSYQPTKIAVEIEVKNQGQLDQDYQDYLRGDLNLEINEVHQIAFQLAKQLGHKQVHAIDWMDTIPGQKGLDEAIEWAKENQPDLYKLIIERASATEGSLNEETSLLDLYRRINKLEHVKNDHETYMYIARIGERGNYVGMDWLRWWYQRNLIIYSNLTRLIEDKKDRVFLLIGAGHLHLVNQFLEESNLFDVEYADTYL